MGKYENNWGQLRADGDGIFNSHLMQGDDYWFLLKYQDADSGIQNEFKGHFTKDINAAKFHPEVSWLNSKFRF